MNVYRGNNRRQVGGGLFSTIMRGAKPLILSLFARMKPHLIDAGKTVGKRAAKAALNVGTDLTSNLIAGRLNKRKAGDIFNSEINDMRTDANKFIEGYKQKYVTQLGSGKRRKLKMPRRKKNINRGGKAVKRLKKRTLKKVPKSQKAIKRYKRKSTKKSKKNKTVCKDIFGK